jgi:hypothetical protein
MIPLKALQNQVKILVDDLRVQVPLDEKLLSSLKQEYGHARSAQRTAGTFESWLEDVLDQAAVAWVLGCVFVRFCEDNGLVKGLWIGGPTSAAPVDRAVQQRQAYLIAHHDRNDRHWLREAFNHLGKLGATGKIFDEHNPLWRFDISGQTAEDLSDFFRRGDGFASVESPGLDTRFLGDLYQDLSAHARETYALLQTPEFVEEFILDRTFEPAYREFGLAATKLIDPTCGSGHFLLGAFDRLITRWKEREPATEARVLVQRALDQVTGVDINPFAVAVARFRLMIAALKSCGLSDLETAPVFNLRLATGDSLLGWGDRDSTQQGDLLATLNGQDGFAYATEDADVLGKYLMRGTYTVVVGNPPYITVKDKALNQTYREIYPKVCHRQYQLTVPFAKRFFDLAKRGDAEGLNAGWVGQITGNGFMKREFGTKLINDYFAHDIELTEVIDTSGAYIPGHGTPTVILVGRANSRRRSELVRLVLGVRGEPGQPSDAAEGLVWHAIATQIDLPGSDSDWISVADTNRSSLQAHPWSLSGGGASGVMVSLESRGSRRLSDVVDEIGFGAVTREDSAYMIGDGPLRRRGVPPAFRLPIVEGDVTRDWLIASPVVSIWPYDENSLKPSFDQSLLDVLWPLRRILSNRVAYGSSQIERGLRWYEYSMFFAKRFQNPYSIAFGFVATHNHFVLDRGGKVFKQSAPVIKLPEGATEDDHLRLLGVLNSSIACFWLKQVSQPKAGGGVGRGMQDEAWEERYEFTGTKLQEFPLPSAIPLQLGKAIDGLAQRLAGASPATVTASDTPTRRRLDDARFEWDSARAQMISMQEELDWEIYRLYELIDEDLTAKEAPALALGERAFEIVLARKVATGEAETQWFARHRATSVTELPAHWSADYKALVNRRIAMIESDRNIGLIERPDCKRRWSLKRDKVVWDWPAQEAAALCDWLLDRLEAPELWAGAPAPLSVAQLADKVRHDDDFRAVLDLWVGSDQHDLVKTIGKLVADEHVPYLPALRYKPTGLRKRVQWERTWELQRREDAGEQIKDIPVPPKYTSADFLKAGYWRNRGKLDVPKERFVSYPKAGRDGDATELLGWAGWDHLAQAQALATVYLDRKNQAAWKPEQLLPLLAGLAELEPWLQQWHGDPRPGFPGTPAKFFTGLIDTELATLGSDRPTLTMLRGLA